MHPLRAALHRHFGVVIAFLALALIVRAAVPQGYMPDTAGGTLAVKLCTSGQVVLLPITGKDNERGDTHDREQAPCAFGALTHAAAPSSWPPIPLLPLQAENDYRELHDHFVLAQSHRQLPPARAPPPKA